MNKRDSPALGAHSWRFIDHPHARSAAPGQRRVEVVHSEADMVNPRAAPGDESADRAVHGFGFEQLDQRPAARDEAVAHFKAQGEHIAVPVAGNFSTNEAAIVVRAALNGTGIALLPRFAAAQALADGRLLALLPEFEVESLGAFAVYLSRERMPSALRVLIDFLAEHLALAAPGR